MSELLLRVQRARAGGAWAEVASLVPGTLPAIGEHLCTLLCARAEAQLLSPGAAQGAVPNRNERFAVASRVWPALVDGYGCSMPVTAHHKRGVAMCVHDAAEAVRRDPSAMVSVLMG